MQILNEIQYLLWLFIGLQKLSASFFYRKQNASFASSGGARVIGNEAKN